MADDTKPFDDCLDGFADHQYEYAANLALNLFQRRRFFWIIQVILISLERIGNYTALSGLGDFAYNSFSEHPWNLALIDVSLGRREGEALRSAATDAVQRCQLDFYQACRHLTLGDRATAIVGFLASAVSEVQRPERYLAFRECANPEPADGILARVARQATHSGPVVVPYDMLTCARSVLQLLRDEDVQDSSLVLPCLEIIMMKLEAIEPVGEGGSIRSQLQALYNDRDAKWGARTE